MDAYYKKSINKPHSDLLPIAIQHNEFESALAYDLGCGVGNDSRYLAQQGCSVNAVDASAQLLPIIEKIPGDIKFKQVHFERIKLQSCQLIHARYALPFCPAEAFDEFWSQLRCSLQVAGTISGELFGLNDSWRRSGRSFHSIKDIERLFTGFDVCYFDEHEFDRVTAAGVEKHWHVYSFVIKKL